MELASRVDVLSVHVGLNDETRGMVSAKVLAALKPGSIFVNTARGPVVDQAALEESISKRGIVAGLDVFENEPSSDGEWNTSIAQLPGVYGTHHIGASATSHQSVGDEVLRIIHSYERSGSVPNCVNIAQSSPATHMLVVRHLDEVGVLARVLDQLSTAGVNVQEMENIVFQGAIAACARIRLDHAPSKSVLIDIESVPAVHAVSLVALESS